MRGSNRRCLLAVRELPASSPVDINFFTVLGWLFLLLGHYKSNYGVIKHELEDEV